MGKVVSIINLKGGVAKTTTTVQIGECLASEFGKKVLIIDLDPQTNATVCLIDDEEWQKLDDEGKTLFHLFNDKLEKTNVFNITTAIQHGVSNLRLPTLDLLPSSVQLMEIQDNIKDVASKTEYTVRPIDVLKKEIEQILPQYDYVLIDCPPSLGLITQNGLVISDYYLIPTIPDRLSTSGLKILIKKIEKFRIIQKLTFRCFGFVITKYDSRSRTHKEIRGCLPNILKDAWQRVEADIQEQLKNDKIKLLQPPPIFATIMPQATAISDAMDFSRKPNNFRDKYGQSKSGDYYLYQYVLSLTREFMSHVK